MLLETIRIYRRKAENLPWHQQRLERSQKALFGQAGGIVLQELELPGWLGPGLYKCRILYDTQIRQLEFQPYFPKEIQTVALVRNNDISHCLQKKSFQPNHACSCLGFRELLIVLLFRIGRETY